jgi:rhodanese-related sulfurtransferase
LIDVRNTFEYDIGHFVNPNTQQPASNPETQTFPLFDSNFCARQAENFADKKVLMYCTGGIRCEKASVMLKRRGVKDVSQLNGGIHRYLEEYGDQGYFKGLNFVFDQRVAMKPSECCRTAGGNKIKRDVVGKCIECTSPFDEISGSRLCTVCRDLVLVCETCQNNLREYHCRRHSGWKKFYFTFLEVFSRDELECQRNALLSLRNTCVPVKEHKNVRKTLSRQIAKVTIRIKLLENGDAKVDQDAPCRCRTCMGPSTVCDGKCWGFWKTQSD